MRLRRALSNPEQLAAVEKAAQARSQLTMRRRESPRPPATRLRQGAIQEQILAVIRSSQEPISPRQIRETVSSQLDIDLSFNTVYSFLARAMKEGRWPIERLSYGKYQIRLGH